MENSDIFENISPLDHRYYQANKALFDRLRDHLSERASVSYCLDVEIALVRTHLRSRGGLTTDAERLIDSLRRTVTADEVYREEALTHHNVRALVNVIQRNLPEDIGAWVHVGATSVDILDTAQSLKIRDAMQRVILPLLCDLVLDLCVMARQEAETAQVGRTHGRHAVPITFGYMLAEYIARLGKSCLELQMRSGDLRGKLAGAVGSYNALSVLTSDPQGFERSVLAELSIQPSEYSTQLVEPEYLLRLLTEVNIAFGVIANLADDLRHLQRSEIDEVRESFAATQVGSSTMPQKRNPWNCEHIKSLWKTFMPRVQTFFLDQISEHQRDLSNSASSRFAGEFLTGFAAATGRMRSVIQGLQVDHARMATNLALGGDMVLAEPAYICLAQGGHSDAHEVIRVATLRAEKEGTTIASVLKQQPEVWAVIGERLRAVGHRDADAFFAHPQRYNGRAVECTVALCDRYEPVMKSIKENQTNGI